MMTITKPVNVDATLSRLNPVSKPQPLWENGRKIWLSWSRWWWWCWENDDEDNDLNDWLMRVVKLARKIQLIHGKMVLTRKTCVKEMENSFPFVFAFFRRAKILQKVFTFLTCLPFADRWFIRGQSSPAKTFRRSRLDEDELTASTELTTPVHSYSHRACFIGQKILRFFQKTSLYFIYKECCWYLRQM